MRPRKSNGTMKSGAKTTKAKAAAKRADKSGSVPFDEMCRLMRVYGSTKCLRRRQPSGGKAAMKVVSVKRKFYRWFHDLEERFVRDAAGFYRPKFGHEFEIRYREEMRAKDGEILAIKRNKKRIQYIGVGNVTKAANSNIREAPASAIARGNVEKVVKKVANPKTREATASPIASGATIAPASDCAPVSPVSFRDIRDTDLKFELDNDRSASISIVSDTGPLDQSFVAKDGIFDDIERSFFGCEGGVEHPRVQNSPALPLVSDREISDCPGLQSSSSNSSTSSDEEPCSSTSRGSDPHPIDNMLDKSMEEYCEEILSSNGGDGRGPVFHFGAL